MNAYSFRNITLLHLSTVEGHVEACKLLLFQKADVNARDTKCHPCPCIPF